MQILLHQVYVGIGCNVDNMASKGLRAIFYQDIRKIEAGDEFIILLKTILAILCLAVELFFDRFQFLIGSIKSNLY